MKFVDKNTDGHEPNNVLRNRHEGLPDKILTKLVKAKMRLPEFWGEDGQPESKNHLWQKRKKQI